MPDRWIEIVNLLENPPYPTLQEVGDKYGITRERVRQIYKKVTGHGLNTSSLRKQFNKEKKLESVKFYCAACGVPVTRRAKGKHKLCLECSYLFSVVQRDPYEIKTCITCGVEFHPYRNSKSPNNYCSRGCYFKDVKERGLRKGSHSRWLNRRIAKDFVVLKRNDVEDWNEILQDKYNLSEEAVNKITSTL